MIDRDQGPFGRSPRVGPCEGTRILWASVRGIFDGDYLERDAAMRHPRDLRLFRGVGIVADDWR
ncbi:MAG: hypothetical protein ABIP53_00335 [Candidatus Limnocylindrales bacterium]